MAITMMVSRDHANDPDVQAKSDYFGHEAERMSHSYKCPHADDKFADMSGQRSPECDENCKPYGPLYLRTTHVGMVVKVFERNGYNDSDFCAVVYFPATDSFGEVEYGTTRFWTYPNHAEVDASEALQKLYADRELDRRRKEYEAAAERKAMEPAKGKRAKVSGGRKVPIGTEGTLTWVGPDRYSRYRTRVGLKTDNGTVHWLDAEHITVMLESAS